MPSHRARMVPVFAVAALVVGGMVWSSSSFTASAQPSNAQPAGPREGRPGGPGGPGGDRRGPTVEGAMQGMNRAMKALKDNVADGSKRDDNLKTVNELQRMIVLAKSAPITEKMYEHAKAGDDAAKKKVADEFRSRLIAVLRSAIDLEEQIAAGKADDAKATYAKLHDFEESGHSFMGVGED